MEWEYQAPHPGYTEGRVWLDGEEMIDDLVEVFEERGGGSPRHRARGLVRDDDGRMTCVEARASGKRVRFDGEAVILAAGDYGSSREQRTRYYGPGYGKMKVRGSRYNTGEAIHAAMDVGTKSDVESPDAEGGITRIDGYQYGVILNHEGERFLDEGRDWRSKTYAKYGHELMKQPHQEGFVLADARTDNLVVAGEHGYETRIEAETFDGLVGRLGIGDEETAFETIEAYNAACDEGTKWTRANWTANTRWGSRRRSRTGRSPPGTTLRGLSCQTGDHVRLRRPRTDDERGSA